MAVWYSIWHTLQSNYPAWSGLSLRKCKASFIQTIPTFWPRNQIFNMRSTVFLFSLITFNLYIWVMQNICYLYFCLFIINMAVFLSVLAPLDICFYLLFSLITFWDHVASFSIPVPIKVTIQYLPFHLIATCMIHIFIFIWLGDKCL